VRSTRYTPRPRESAFVVKENQQRSRVGFHAVLWGTKDASEFERFVSCPLAIKFCVFLLRFVSFIRASLARVCVCVRECSKARATFWGLVRLTSRSTSGSSRRSSRGSARGLINRSPRVKSDGVSCFCIKPCRCYKIRGGCRRFGGGPARPVKKKTSRDAGERSGGIRGADRPCGVACFEGGNDAPGGRVRC